MKISYKVMPFVMLSVSLSGILVMACTAKTPSSNPKMSNVEVVSSALAKQETQTDESTIKKIDDIPIPKGFNRPEIPQGSFGAFLRELPLKPAGSPVMLYNGDKKWNQNAHFAVIDLPIGALDLHQCADAVMRIRADYLRAERRFDEIHFKFVSGFNCEYTKWIQGYRVRVSGNSANWYQTNATGDSDREYWKYLEMVWSYASTLSLEKELSPKPISQISIGDIWIKGGSPGHAILVIDIAENNSGQKLFLLAQSYMPAQETHVLRNPTDEHLSPWYEVPNGDLITPEWTFHQSELREW